MNIDWKLLKPIAIVIFAIAWIFHDNWIRLKNLENAKNIKIKNFQLIFYFFLFLPYFYIHRTFEKIYKLVISVILQQKETEFAGFLGGQNLLYFQDFKSKCEVPTLVLMKFNGPSEEFYKTMKLHIHNVLYHKLEQNQEICGEITSYGGFFYIKRDKVINLDNYVKDFVVQPRSPDRTLNKRQLLDYIAQKWNSPFNPNKTPLWTIFIGKQSVKWNDDDNTVCYPVIFKFSHCLLDRVNFMKLILGTFADITDLNLLFPVVTRIKYQLKDYLISLKGLPRKLFHKMFYFLLTKKSSAFTILANHHLLKKKDDELVVRRLNQSIFLDTMDMGPDFLQKVNAIKSRFPNATEFSIIEAAIAASLTNYCRRTEGDRMPVDIVCMSVENAECGNLTESSPESLKFEKVTFKSNTGFTLLNICTPKDQRIKVQEILKQSYKQKNVDSSTRNEVEITRALFNGSYCNFIDVMKNALSADKSISTLISNFPGPSSAITMNGLTVEHIINWSPQLLGAGVAFTVCSYRGTYQLTININKALLNTIENVETLLKDIEKYMNELSVE